MESLEEKIKKFIKVNPGYSYSYSFGFSDGSGYGFGDGSGYGSGDGSGDGFGYGDGSGFDNGSGSGSGYGYGSGYEISNYNNMQVNVIDGVRTIITAIKDNIAKGYILNADLMTSPCYIIKRNNLFAHGKTVREANEALNNKLFNGMSTEDRIDMFIKEFEMNKKYKASKFYDWHNKLTGSCQIGRDSFVKDNGIDLESEYTVKEFIDLTKNNYGSAIIKELAKAIDWRNNK